MSRSTFGRRGRLLLVAAVLTAGFAMPMTVLGDTTTVPTIYPASENDATIDLDTGPIIGRVLVQATVTFTCEPFLVYDWETGMEVETTEGNLEFGMVSIIQAAGRTINYGEGEFYGGDVVCDGTTANTREVSVGAMVIPWKKGTAVAGARIAIVSPDWNSGHGASTGPLTVKLGR
ncbi:MAG TPA: hypothetical protein VFO73_00420 [Candidatus Limnocylindrales bacterium]|nr:hypothetical protein [Candidatus Limnocylindrales bacterium]